MNTNSQKKLHEFYRKKFVMAQDTKILFIAIKDHSLIIPCYLFISQLSFGKPDGGCPSSGGGERT